MSSVLAALTLVGAGRMGGALLRGWLANGFAGAGTIVIEPTPTPDLASLCATHGLSLNPVAAKPANTLVLAIKPQALDAAAPMLAALTDADTLLVSILAGKSIADLSARVPKVRAIVRAMPNTPAAIGQGISGLVANDATATAQRAFAQALLEAVGETLWVPNEGLMDAVTAVSGSGPAYLFLLAETLAEAARAAGLPDDLAARLARKTVEGAAALMAGTPELTPATLRGNVTSPGGTTAAALGVLMADDALASLMRRAVAAAVRRGQELAG